MPAGDPAGYLPAVKRSRRKKGQPTYQPRASHGPQMKPVPVSVSKRPTTNRQFPESQGSVSAMKPFTKKADSRALADANRIEAAMRPTAKGGVKGATKIGHVDRAGSDAGQDNFKRGRREYHVFTEKGKRRVKSFLRSNKRRLH